MGENEYDMSTLRPQEFVSAGGKKKPIYVSLKKPRNQSTRDVGSECLTDCLATQTYKP